MTTYRFVLLGGGGLSSRQANMIPAPFDMTLKCKAKAVIKKFSKFGNEKLTFELNSRTIFP
jgi:hypothetical protein